MSNPCRTIIMFKSLVKLTVPTRNRGQSNVPYGHVVRPCSSSNTRHNIYAALCSYCASRKYNVQHTCGPAVQAILYCNNIYNFNIICVLYRTYQRQQPDEHVRLADKVLDVELAADFAGPVGLRTSIHLWKRSTTTTTKKTTTIYDLYIIGRRRWTETFTPRRTRYAGLFIILVILF